jgi:hypothetical protein
LAKSLSTSEPQLGWWANSRLVARPDISNNVGPVKSF